MAKGMRLPFFGTSFSSRDAVANEAGQRRIYDFADRAESLYIQSGLHSNKTRSFRPITILITNHTKPPVVTCFDCLRETETALDSLAGNLGDLREKVFKRA